MFILICLLSILLIPSIAHAWGPLTHLYLGHQIIELGAALVPAGIYTLLKRFGNDFLYGNLCADIILGRRFQSAEKSSHNWDIGWRLLESAKTNPQKSFAHGYLAHLSADTVIHNLKGKQLPFRHSILEVKADSIIHRDYRGVLRNLHANTLRNDTLLEDILESVFFSFKTNRRIFKGFLLLSTLPNYRPLSRFIHKRLPNEIPVKDIYKFQQESLNRMFELLKNGKSSKVLREHPLGRHRFYYGISGSKVRT